MQISLAPGHVYIPELGSGILWEPAQATLYQRGEIIAVGSHSSPTAWDFWYNLAFAQTFPQVEHWWFRGVWTGPLKISQPVGAIDSQSIMGFMQFGNDETPATLWSITDHGQELEVAIGYPEHETEPINIPLRLALTRCILGTITGAMPTDTWMAATSLVTPHELEMAFPIDTKSLVINMLPYEGGLMALLEEHPDINPEVRTEYIFRLEGVYTSLRTAFCQLQGLKQP